MPENYEKFVNLVRRSSNKNIPRGCRTSYVCGIYDQSKDMYEDYQRRFAEDPFNEDTVRVGDALLDEISEAQCSKWKESTVKLLYRGGRTDELKNYRPIAIINITCKLCMLMVRERIDKWTEYSGMLGEIFNAISEEGGVQKISCLC